MAIHFLNCFTCNARVPSDWHTGTLCLLIETNRGPVLVDTGPGLSDYVHKPGIVRAFQLVTQVHRREYEAFTGRPRRWTDLAYVRRHIAHRPEFVLYDDADERWFGLTAIRLPFKPEMWLIPLFGHAPGHCGVAVQTESGWLFHVGDAAPLGLDEVRMTTGHMWLDFFTTAPPQPW
jgi:glyoxylase-like metal-dependent hydrolase (beta-lactamase superfamily II)